MILLGGCCFFVSRVSFFCYQLDYDEVWVVVLMMRNLWVVFVFRVFFCCLLVVTLNLVLSLLPFTRVGFVFFSSYRVVHSLIWVVRFWVVFDMVLFALPFHLLTVLWICRLDSGRPIVFASRFEFSV